MLTKVSWWPLVPTKDIFERRLCLDTAILLRWPWSRVQKTAHTSYCNLSTKTNAVNLSTKTNPHPTGPDLRPQKNIHSRAELSRLVLDTDHLYHLVFWRAVLMKRKIRFRIFSSTMLRVNFLSKILTWDFFSLPLCKLILWTRCGNKWHSLSPYGHATLLIRHHDHVSVRHFYFISFSPLLSHP